jgi:tripartite-type tricarboxylate transporter receptor subunit TctC
MARLVAGDLSKLLGQSVVVDNRPGAGGFVGWRSVVTAKPDGYTLLFSENAIAINTALRRDRAFDPVTSLDAIASIATAPLVLVVAKNVEADSLEKLIALSKKNPTALTFSSSGIGSVSHVTFEALASATGMSAVHIPYKGGGEALTAVAGGHASASMTTVHIAKQMIDAGEVKGILVTGPDRISALPNLPSQKEAGVDAGVDLVFWYGIFGPRNLPEKVKVTIQDAVKKLTEDPAVRERLAKLNINMNYGNAEFLGSKLKLEIKGWQALIEKAGIKAE